MANNKLKDQKIVKYLNKDFDGFRSDLLEFAKAHFNDIIGDFSENSVGGMFLDLTAYVGDVMSFYMDHQFSELFIDTVREPKNVVKIAKQLGLKPTPPTPSVALCTFTIDAAAAENKDGVTVPDPQALLKLKRGTLVESEAGIIFQLTEHINFSKLSDATVKVSAVNSTTNIPTSFFITKQGLCVSGEIKDISISIPNVFQSFRQIELTEANITEIISIRDSALNDYYEVDYLSQDTVFETIENIDKDMGEVPFIMAIKPVPFRFISEYNPVTELTTLTFGSGKAKTIDDDIVPDPSEFAMPLYGRKTLTRFSVNPQQFLNTKTLGISPMGTTLTVRVRVGGGLDHNVAPQTISTINAADVEYLTANKQKARSSASTLTVTNHNFAGGGEDKQSLEDLKLNASSNFATQSRLVTREDYISRLYSMPSKFGRIYKAFATNSKASPLTVEVNVLSRNSAGQLVVAPDSLKLNLKTFLNEYKIITDSIEILDGDVINLGIEFEIVVKSSFNQTEVLSNVLSSLRDFFDIDNFQIGQPIILSEVEALIFSNEGVLSITDRIKIKNHRGVIGGREYSFTSFSTINNTDKGVVLCPHGSIFEIKYPNIDIKGSAI